MFPVVYFPHFMFLHNEALKSAILVSSSPINMAGTTNTHGQNLDGQHADHHDLPDSCNY